MHAIVPDLVDMASDPKVSAADLLRRALVVASRLEQTELSDWIGAELNGYVGPVPAYRKIRGDLKAINPFHGLIPFQLPPELARDITEIDVHQSVPELVKLAASDTGVQAYLAPELEQMLMGIMEVPLRPILRMSTVQIHGIVERVRSRILDWALSLERSGVLGKGSSFTSQERAVVQQQHFHIGNVTGSQIQISSNGSNQSLESKGSQQALEGLISVLEKAFKDGSLKGQDGDEMRAELATLRAQAASPRPKWSIVKATAESVKSELEKLAVKALLDKAMPYLVSLLPS